MKKFILFAVVAMMGIVPVSADTPKDSNENKDAIVLTRRGRTTDDTRSRSWISENPIVVYLDLEMGQIEVIFDIPEGTATTTIVNAFGQAVYRYTCDSEIEWMLYLPLPAEEGDYTLKIETSAASYEGHFSL